MSTIPEASTSARFLFDNLGSAAQGLLVVILDSRTTDEVYRFGGLAAEQVLNSGLMLEGSIDAISAKLEAVPGCVKSAE